MRSHETRDKRCQLLLFRSFGRQKMNRKNTNSSKLVLLGAGGVGKTSLLVQYLGGLFPSTHTPTVEDYYRHTLRMPDGSFRAVDILDTSGSHPFPAMRELSMRSGRWFVLVFSVDDLHSFHEALELWDRIRKIRGSRVPVLLVGNKSDLARTVTREMVREALGNAKYLETSAKSNVNVGGLFAELLEHARKLEQPPTPPPKRRSIFKCLSQ